jgi:DNA-binding beta-propeller fold protein YncE
VRMWCFRVSGMLLVVLVVLGSSRTPLGRAAGGKTQTDARVQDAVPPAFELDPSWPRPSAVGKAWPDLKRAATSVAVDSHDHVWALYVPGAAEQQAEAAGAQVPRVFEFDSKGNLLQSWGGPGKGNRWMENQVPRLGWPTGTPAEHGMFIDHKDNVWVTGNGHIALKFSPQGKFLLQIGELWKSNGSNDHKLLGNACELTVDPQTNEVYVADGYNNRRIVVFDADTGAYKRHWGAYGKRPVDVQFLTDKNGLIADTAEFYLPAGAPQRQFLGVHCVRVSTDGLVYVCDRHRNRVQVFRKDGTFVREIYVAPDTPVDLGFVSGPGARFGAPSTIGFSKDPEQRYLYLGDNQNFKILIFRRRDLQVMGSFRTNTNANHYLTVDSQGNIYNTGLQRFVFKGVPTRDELLKRTNF